MYSNMYSIGIKITTWSEGKLLLVDDFVRKHVKAVTVTNLMFTTRKIWIKSYSVNWDARSSFMNSKTHMVVMEVVSQQLDEYKNNGLISKLYEILSGHIWICFLVWFLINHGFMLWL